VVGLVRLPASILSNNGGQVVSNNGGGLISDQGGSLLSNNGATLISDQGGGLVSNNGAGAVSSGGTRYRLRQALAAGGGQDLVAIANAQVGLFDARGQAVRDASGVPLVTLTDGAGRYAFPTAPADRALVVVVQLAGTAGQAAALVPKARAEVAIDLASSVMTSYVISRFARTQPDPQAALERLPADLEAKARQATAEALAQGSGPDRLEAAAAVQAVEALRASAGAVDLLYEEVRRAMVIAGQANLSEGQPARTAELNLGLVRRTTAGQWWLVDWQANRLWEVVDGRLRVLAGSGVDSTRQPEDGAVARDVALGHVRSVREGAGGVPWLLHAQGSTDFNTFTYALSRLEPGGRLRRLWSDVVQLGAGNTNFWQLVDVVLLGGEQALVIGTNRIVPVGGAPEHPIDLRSSEVTAVDRRPDGRIRLAVRHYGWKDGEFTRTWRLWELRPGAPATALESPTEPHWFGFDDAGHLVTGTPDGALAFYPPGGGPPIRFKPEVTAAWPSWLRPKPEVLDLYPELHFGGDVATTGWVCRYERLSTYGPDGVTVPVIEGPSEAAPTDEGATALSTPRLAAMGADGALYLVDRGAVVLRVMDKRAEVFAGRTYDGTIVPVAAQSDPFGYGLQVLDAKDKLVSEVPGFGAGYAVSAREAYFTDPAALRVAPDGSVWLLDTMNYGIIVAGKTIELAESFVRRIVGGRVETVAVKSSQDRDAWIDMVPAPNGEAVVLAQGESQVRLLRVKGAQAPVELARVPHAAPPEGCEDCRNDGLAPLPGGGWLLRVQGVLWRWMPGQQAVRLGIDGIATDSSVEHGTLMTASGDGKVVIADATRVYRIDPTTGKATPVVGRGTANLAGATPDTSVLNITGLAVAPGGDLLITDDEARQVKRVPARDW
jgi:hypothetical protein